MVRNGEKHERNGKGKGNQTKGDLEGDVDALFRLPLSEFTGARKTLAAHLKKSGRGNDADRVKELPKPPISAWAVNQLYWRHREAFNRLIATGQRFRQAQTSRLAVKITDMRGALDARREALSDLSRLADELLREADHNPSPDTLRRINNTLEAISAYGSLPDSIPPGRLTHDVDPPGFDSLASMNPGAVITQRTELPPRMAPSQKASAPANSRQKVAPVDNVRQLEVARQARIAAARVSLQDAKRVLIKAQARAQSAAAAQKKAHADSKEKEKQRREAEQRFEKARAASEDAARRAEIVATELAEAATAEEHAERSFEKATKELESLS
jgi:hypothetical protein